MSAPVIANPPAFPGSRPVNTPFVPITAPRDIFADFLNMWTSHVRLTVSSKKAIGEAFAGVGSYAERVRQDDLYRTNRYDLESHYVRAFDHDQSMPLSTPEQIASPVGRELVRLMDQHISDTDALMVKALAAKKVFDVLSAQQTAFLQQEQQNQTSVIPGNTPDDIVARALLKLRLLARTSGEDVAAGANVGSNAAQLVAAGKAFDGVTDVITNGVKIINIMANVYVSVAQGLGPQRYAGDITKAVAQHYAAFGRLVADDAYFQGHQAENIATLAKAGLMTSGNAAQDVWNAHLVQVAILVDAETTVDAALKAGAVTPAQRKALDEARAGVEEHAAQLAGLASISFGIPAYKVLNFPAPERLA
jgi:hypothetical protein